VIASLAVYGEARPPGEGRRKVLEAFLEAEKQGEAPAALCALVPEVLWGQITLSPVMAGNFRHFFGRRSHRLLWRSRQITVGILGT
jgi:hypothetical protein